MGGESFLRGFDPAVLSPASFLFHARSAGARGTENPLKRQPAIAPLVVTVLIWWLFLEQTEARLWQLRLGNVSALLPPILYGSLPSNVPLPYFGFDQSSLDVLYPSSFRASRECDFYRGPPSQSVTFRFFFFFRIPGGRNGSYDPFVVICLCFDNMMQVPFFFQSCAALA